MRYVFFALALCAQSLPAAAQPFSLERNGETLRFSGDLSPEAAEAISGQLRMGVHRIVIGHSGGEDDGYGRRLSSAIVTGKLSVSVENSCLAACAQFIFLAARKKELQQGAVLGMRGGLPESLPGSASARLSALLLDRLEAAAGAFTLRGAKVGKALGVPALVNSAVNSGESVDLTLPYYFPSRAVLEKAGVTGLGEYAYPSDLEALNELGRQLNLPLIGDFNSVPR